MRFRLAGRAVVAGLAAVLTLSACGGSDAKTDTANASGLEKTKITIGALPIPDSAALYIANKRGFFQKEGLTVDIQVVQGGAQAQQSLFGGSLDATQTNYVSTFLATAAGNKPKIISDLYQATPNSFNLMVAKDSSIKTPADLKGKKIAVNSLRNIGTLSVTSVLKTHGLTDKDVEFLEFPFPDMAGKLEQGVVDAAWMTEPHLTAVQKNIGAQKLADTMVDSTADFPIAGVIVTEDFAAKNPKTVAAFQRAVAEAQKISAADRKAVEEILPTYTKGIDAATAAVITLGTFPTSLDATRLQRVADLMLEQGLLKSKIEAKSLLLGNSG
ncbi:ABC transporter substrate-binding protein [Streptosporangium roseum]|uniref:ABC-type nitrate/sulfonate/bicarbonate transport systems periplasmic components-like protein n=1 Tax=Streptosporangium roseum (strain ATCC 12428 / DSM 43021 / JCM 3005 / KCTC 9067 / NCIMB 10171 / NRRL 2505 / NI 9100) TaxID=479432 RepID=D2ATD3_STRRD|nr:ABC transporter substrate-binding protein [Streptosporangium roseum]ACZ84809.1 ABC-type nitrate/sulfonate/bicarbonate transport systems periplasmic components-like protein [Streptosporangium roseum DSM 43021]